MATKTLRAVKGSALSFTELDDNFKAAEGRVLGRVSAGEGVIEELTAAQIRTLANVEDGADVTDTANVTAAGALMDSEVTNLAAVKAFDATDYATAAQGSLADSAVQPADLSGSTITAAAGTLNLSGTNNGFVLTQDGTGNAAFAAPAGGGTTEEQVEDWVGGMVGGASVQTNITVTYDDVSGELDFVVPAASTTVAGAVELATNAETVTGTDTARAVTPDGLTDRLAAPGTIGGTTPGTGIFSSLTVGGETITALADPNADRILFWDDSAGSTAYLTVGTGLDLTDTTLTAAVSALDDLSDLTITSPVIKHFLEYNGSAWVNTLGPNYKLVYNNSGGTIAAGTIVSVNGSFGAVAAVVVADKDTAPDADGIAVQTFGAATTGLIQLTGEIQESFINTTGMTAGGTLYLGDAGAYTTTSPGSGSVVPIGRAGVIAGTNGSLLLDMPAIEVYHPGGTDVAVADGGTGASTALAAVNNLSPGMAPVTLTDGATITPDFSAGRNFKVTLAGNRTLANPTNQVAGYSGRIAVTQDATGSRTLAYGANWKFNGGAPTLSTAANAVDLIVYDVEASGTIYATFLGAFA